MIVFQFSDLPGEQSVLLPFHIIKTKVKGSGCYPESLAVECFQKEGLPHFYFATVPFFLYDKELLLLQGSFHQLKDL